MTFHQLCVGDFVLEHIDGLNPKSSVRQPFFLFLATTVWVLNVLKMKLHLGFDLDILVKFT